MKTTQQSISSFPNFIVVDLSGLNCKSQFGLVKPGVKGYHPLYVAPRFTRDSLEALYIRTGQLERKATQQEQEAALNGSMFGWDVPAARIE